MEKPRSFCGIEKTLHMHSSPVDKITSQQDEQQSTIPPTSETPPADNSTNNLPPPVQPVPTQPPPTQPPTIQPPPTQPPPPSPLRPPQFPTTQQPTAPNPSLARQARNIYNDIQSAYVDSLNLQELGNEQQKNLFAEISQNLLQDSRQLEIVYFDLGGRSPLVPAIFRTTTLSFCTLLSRTLREVNRALINTTLLSRQTTNSTNSRLIITALSLSNTYGRLAEENQNC